MHRLGSNMQIWMPGEQIWARQFTKWVCMYMWLANTGAVCLKRDMELIIFYVAQMVSFLDVLHNAYPTDLPGKNGEQMYPALPSLSFSRYLPLLLLLSLHIFFQTSPLSFSPFRHHYRHLRVCVSHDALQPAPLAGGGTGVTSTERAEERRGRMKGKRWLTIICSSVGEREARIKSQLYEMFHSYLFHSLISKNRPFTSWGKRSPAFLPPQLGTVCR